MSKPTSSAADSASIDALANQMTQTSKASTAEGSQLFSLALPGLTQAESYYGKLASGSPQALSTANAPAIAGITQASDSAKKSIVQDNPRGGERNLALEEADLSKGAQISSLTTGSYASAFPSLAQVGGQNVSQGTAATGQGIQAAQGAANQYQGLLSNNASDKASTLGMFGSLAGAGAEVAGAYA